MKILKSIPIYCTLAVFALGSVQLSAQSVTTTPVGYVTLTIQGENKYNFLSIPLVNQPLFKGQINSVTNTVLSTSSDVWTANEYASGYYVEITSNGSDDSGNAKGLFVDITGNTANSLTLADDLSTYTFNGDETIAIYKHHTIGSVFGTNNSSGLQGGTSAGDADVIKIWNPLTQRFSSYFYNSAVNEWKSATNPFGPNTSSEVFYADQGFVVYRKGTGTVEMKVIGSVKVGSTKAQIFSGYNFYDNKKPIDTTLGETGWENDISGGTSAGDADTISIWNSVTQRLASYFYNSITRKWENATNPFGADAGDTQISVGDAILIKRRSDPITLSEKAINLN